MKKLLLILLLASTFLKAQWPPERANPSFLPALRLSDSLQLDFLGASDTLFLTQLQGQNLVTALSITQLRNLISVGSLDSVQVLAIVRNNLDTSGTLTLDQAAQNGSVINTPITISAFSNFTTPTVQALNSGGINIRNSAGTNVLTLGLSGTNITFNGNSGFQNTYRLLNLPDPTAAQEAATKAYVDNGIANTLDFADTVATIATKFDVASITSSGITRGELTDTANAIRTTITNELSNKLNLSDTASMLTSYVQQSTLPATIVESVVAGTGITINSADPANPIINASGSGAGVTKRVITQNADTITNLDEEVLFISQSGANDTLFLAANLSLDSLSNFYFENVYGGDLVIVGGVTNNLVTRNNPTGTIGATITVGVGEGGFIKSLGTVAAAIRFAAIGGYTE